MCVEAHEGESRGGLQKTSNCYCHPGRAGGSPILFSLVGLPPGEFPTPIFDVVLKRITVRGSIVGTRRDLDEAIAFAANGKVKAEITKARLEDINTIFADLKAGRIQGRMVLDFSEPVRNPVSERIAVPA